MNLKIDKLKKIFKEEGLIGLRFRLNLRFYKLYYLIKKFLQLP